MIKKSDNLFMANDIRKKLKKTGKEILDKVTEDGYWGGMIILIQSNPDAVRESEKFFITEFNKNLSAKELINIIKFLIKIFEDTVK